MKKSEISSTLQADTYDSFKAPKRRLSPNVLCLTTDSINETDNIISGRVTKNNGIKKYNQRQVKEKIDLKRNSPEERRKSQ